ncbi:hypothetical protein CA267_001710 [Alteromonas pelagimontana]|uniref:Tip attachment protein J domain-containing protein n=1 Tax=Alteromonas pelagimontana TaxID=1858656 RepID=A0A6M4M8R5_9ALTE|nr:hypothetical protein [Alteromonas pelagimontana]QJR79601.1 hypothetical protein CA267_001710 [Alteromonas pelagimontana]
MGLLSGIGDFLFGWMAPDVEQAGPPGTELNSASTEANIPKIFGKVKKQSALVAFKQTNDNDSDDIKNDLLHIIVVWGYGVESIDELYIDDIAYSSNSTAFEHDGGGRAVYAVNFINGMDGYVDSNLTRAGWGTSDKLTGLACTYFRFEYHGGENAITSEPKLTADLTGTAETNPGYALKDLLKSPIYGKGLNDSFINLPAVSACNSLSSQLVETYIGSGVYRPLFTCNTALDTENSVFDNVNTILKSMRAIMPILNGKLTPIIEQDQAPVPIIITQDDIIEMDDVKNSSKSNRYNRVIVKYYDPDADGTAQEAVYPIPDSDEDVAWLAEDNGFRLEKSFDRKTCDNYYEALEHAKTLARISREQLHTTITLPKWATVFEVGDIVPVQHDYYEWNEEAFPDYGGKLFRITSSNENRREVTLSIREHQPYLYDFFGQGNKPALADSGINNAPPSVPTGVTVTPIYDGNRQLRISWSGDASRFDYQVLSVGGDVVETSRIARSYVELASYSLGSYTFRVRAVGGMAELSAWSTPKDLEVSGLDYFTWKIYADDINGASPSKTDATKPFIGYLYGQLKETFDINAIDISQFGFFPNTASQWLFGEGTPPAAMGNVGDTYLEQTTGDIYKKTSSGWGSPVGNISGSDGDKWLSGTSAPAAGTGSNGDMYLNTTNYALYQKVNGTWEPRGTIKGEQGIKGDTGDKGDDGEDGKSAPNVIAHRLMKWDFRTSIYGWTPLNYSSANIVNKTLRVISNGGGSVGMSRLNLQSVSGSDYHVVLLKVKCISASLNTTARLYYIRQSQAGTGYTSTQRVDLPVKYKQGEWTYLEFDMRAVSLWTSNNLYGVRVDVGPAANYEIDSIYIGYYGNADETDYDDGRISNDRIQANSDGTISYQLSNGSWVNLGKVTRAGLGAISDSEAQAMADDARDAAFQNALASALLRNPSGEGLNFMNPLYQNPVDGVPVSTGSGGEFSINTWSGHPNPSRGSMLQLTANASGAYMYLGKTVSEYNIKLMPNRKWIVSFWIKTGEGYSFTNQVHFAYINGSGQRVHLSQNYTTPGRYNASRVSVVMDMTQSNNSAVTDVILRLDCDTSGYWLLFDQIMIEPVRESDTNGTEPSPYVKPFLQPPILKSQILPMTALGGARTASVTSSSSEQLLTSTVDPSSSSKARITIASHTLQTGDGPINYGAKNIDGKEQDKWHYVYIDDPYFVGGTTYGATTSVGDLTANNYRYYIDAIQTYVSGGGTTYPPMPYCPHAETWLTETLQAKDAQVGDTIDAVTNGEIHKAEIISICAHRSDCVRITSASGCVKTVSVWTPIDLRDGSTIRAINLWGHQILAEVDGKLVWEDIVNLEFIEDQPVMHLSLGGMNFLGGKTPHNRLVTHNIQQKR